MMWAGIDELADRYGGFCWVEARLFEVLGQWSVIETEHRATALWATTSRHCAWHSDLWRDQLPDSPALGADERVVAPEAWSGWQEALDAGSAGASADRHGAFGPVMRSLMAEYDDVAARLVPASDRAASRTLAFVLSDHRAALAESDGLLNGDAGINRL